MPRETVQQAEGYREQSVADATGQAARFSKVYDEYQKAPAIIRERIFLETMERVFGGMDKVIIDQNGQGQGVVPYLPLTEIAAPAGRTDPGDHPMNNAALRTDPGHRRHPGRSSSCGLRSSSSSRPSMPSCCASVPSRPRSRIRDFTSSCR